MHSWKHISSMMLCVSMEKCMLVFVCAWHHRGRGAQIITLIRHPDGKCDCGCVRVRDRFLEMVRMHVM